MTVRERQLRVDGVLENVSVICDFVVERAREAGLDARAIHHCYLAVDEACTNIIEHGYGPDCYQCTIEVLCQYDDSAMTITIVDDSPSFDPLIHTDPDPNTPLNQRGEGGWGIFFIKKLMDSVTYSYEGSRNRLVMVKQRGKSAPTHEVREGAAPMPIGIADLTGNVWQITPNGRLDELHAEHLTDVLNEQLAAGHRWLIINMSEVEFLSSAGLKALVSAWQRVRDQKGELALAAVRPRVGEVLEMIGLDMVFKISTTTDQARDHLVSKVK
jgi:serine/threonine-protein kinase RsbW